jgi:hypothetical protein
MNSPFRHAPSLLQALLTAAGLTVLAGGVAAQVAPDFTGRWATEPAATGRGAAGDMGSGWGSPLTITQDAAKLTIEYAFFGRGDMQPPMKFVYALDGTETKNSVMMGRGIQAQTSKTAWDGERLMITTLHTFADPVSGKPQTTEVRQTLSLESPTVLIVETVRAGVMGGPASATKTTYRKQP